MGYKRADKRYCPRAYEAPGGKDITYAYRSLCGAMLHNAVKDIVMAEDPGKRWQALLWLITSEAGQFLFSAMAFGRHPGELLRSGYLTDPKIKFRLSRPLYVL